MSDNRLPALTVWQPPMLALPYLAGVLHGDGWCTGLTLGLRVKDREFAETFAAALNAAMATTLAPRMDERGYWLLKTSNKTGRFSALRQYDPTDNDELGFWLRGLFDSEGNAQLWRDPRRTEGCVHRRVAIYSTDPQTLGRASDYLSWLDVPHLIRTTKNSAGHKGTKVVHELRMLRRDGFTRFAQVIGWSIPRKQAALNAIVASYQAAGWQRRAQAVGVARSRAKRAIRDIFE